MGPRACKCCAKAARHDVINTSPGWWWCKEAKSGPPVTRVRLCAFVFLVPVFLRCFVCFVCVLCFCGAVRRDVAACVRGADFGDLCACGVFERAVFSCIGRGPFPGNRGLHVRCACVCMFPVQSVESRECAVSFFARGGLKSVEHWACPRLRRVGRDNFFVVACVFGLVFVRGWCVRWMFGGGVCKVFGVSVFFSKNIRHDREVANHCSCSTKSSHIVLLVPLVATRVNPDISVHQVDEQMHGT